MDKVFKRTLINSEEFLGLKNNIILKNLKQYEKMIINSENGQENNEAYNFLTDLFLNKFAEVKKLKSYPETPKKDKDRFFSHLLYHLKLRDIPYVLRMEDRNSMYNNLEARVPFLDYNFTKYV